MKAFLNRENIYEVEIRSKHYSREALRLFDFIF